VEYPLSPKLAASFTVGVAVTWKIESIVTIDPSELMIDLTDADVAREDRLGGVLWHRDDRSACSEREVEGRNQLAGFTGLALVDSRGGHVRDTA
jgi:hypothetical protein